jgi:hypothetical protein
MKVVMLLIILMVIISGWFVWRRFREGLSPDYTPQCKELLEVPVARIFPDALIPERKQDAINKFSNLKDDLEEQARMGNETAKGCSLIVGELIAFLNGNDMKGFSDALKKLLI